MNSVDTLILSSRLLGLRLWRALGLDTVILKIVWNYFQIQITPLVMKAKRNFKKYIQNKSKQYQFSVTLSSDWQRLFLFQEQNFPEGRMFPEDREYLNISYPLYLVFVYFVNYFMYWIFKILTSSLSFTYRCPLKRQNYDYAMYLLTVLYHESWVSDCVWMFNNFVSVI